MEEGQVSRECFFPERVSMDIPDIREVQFQETLDLWVLPFSEVCPMESETVSLGGGEGQGCTNASSLARLSPALLVLEAAFLP